MRAGADNDPRRPPRKQSVPPEFLRSSLVRVKAECKSGKPYPVEKPFEKGRHGAPPIRVHDNEMIGPADIILRAQKIGLERLDSPIPFAENRVEGEFVDIKAFYLMPRIPRGFLIGICELP